VGGSGRPSIDDRENPEGTDSRALSLVSEGRREADLDGPRETPGAGSLVRRDSGPDQAAATRPRRARRKLGAVSTPAPQPPAGVGASPTWPTFADLGAMLRTLGLPGGAAPVSWPSGDEATPVAADLGTAHPSIEPPARPTDPMADAARAASWTGISPFATETRHAASGWGRGDVEQWTAGPEDPCQWPSAARILEASRPKPAARPAMTRPARRRAARPVPTVGRAPGQWALPLWLVWLPATLLAIAAAVAGLGLSWAWAEDDRVAGLVADRLLGRDAAAEGPVLDPALLPDPSWWRSTAGHLALQAVAASRSPADPGAEEHVRFLLSTARNAAPLQAAVRYALARGGRVRGGDESPAASLGLSRDVVALAWTGRQLLEAGKADAALRAYRAALELAAASDPARGGIPSFDDDPRARRFVLPREDLIGPVVRDMADRSEWTFARWSAALPPSPVVALAAYRALRDKESPDADQALDLALASDGDDPIDVAARAEASALRERWDEAESRYRAAVERMPLDPVRRSWWFNLAAIRGHRDDTSGMRAAWDAARGTRPSDPIYRRVVEAQGRAGVGDAEAIAAPRR
jgi:tetratricopeptide (TPR) repeat protein